MYAIHYQLNAGAGNFDLCCTGLQIFYSFLPPGSIAGL